MIRDATPADGPAIARTHARSWHRAYAELITPEALEYVNEEMLAELWADVLANPQRRTWVWDQGGTIAGVVTLKGDELRSLYVDPVAQGAGVGTALLAEAERGGARMLHTFAANAPARAFYEHHGWAWAADEEPWMGDPIVRYERRR